MLAGQTKPTTAGGILSSGMGGVLAGRAIVKAIEQSDDSFLNNYPKEWHSIFGFEFKKLMVVGRYSNIWITRPSMIYFPRYPSEL